MTRLLHDFPGGLRLKTHKDLSDQEVSLQHPLPARIILPLQQHIGIAAEPVVRIGDKVLKGQTIARANGYVSLPVHASTSGKVIDIDNYPVPHPAGLEAPCIVIEPDGDDRWFDIKPTHEYASVDPKALQAVIRECGIAGLGGAGFPAHVKLNEGVENAVDTLIINGVECEPHITCDDRLIQEKAGYVVAGTRMIRHAVQARHCVIAVEADMPAAHRALEAMIDGDDIELIQVPTRYPAGGERQLIQVITGKEVPSGGLPIDAGIVMHNVATAAAVYRAVTRGEPVISRYVTITGNIANPRNLQVLLGTPVADCLNNRGYIHDEGNRIILGGPMMGIHINNMAIPITKTTNCILIKESEPRPAEIPCIRCGDCADVCPVKLLPQQLYWHARAGDHDACQTHHLFDCIECGCCAHVCPSNIPLVQYYRHAKAEIADQERRRTGADHARARFVAKNRRLAQQKQNRATEQQASTTQDSTTASTLEQKQSYIEAAVARTQAKRRQMEQQDEPDKRENDDS